MDLSTVPIGQTVTVTNNTYIRITFTRASQSEGIVEEFDPASGRLVLKGRLQVFSGSIVHEFIDTTFWSITLNGKLVAGVPTVSNAQLEADPQTRIIKITTR